MDQGTGIRTELAPKSVSDFLIGSFQAIYIRHEDDTMEQLLNKNAIQEADSPAKKNRPII